MKRPWIYLLILVIFATGLLTACSSGGAASGGINCSHGGELCVYLSTVKTFIMGDAVPIKITVSSSKDISDLHLTLHTGTEVTVNGPQTWESGLSDPYTNPGYAYWDFAIKANQTLTFHRVLHFSQREGYFTISVDVSNIGRSIAGDDYFTVLLTKEGGGQVSMRGTPLPPHTPNVTSAAYGPGTPAPSPLTNPTNPPMLTPSPIVTPVDTSVPLSPAYPAPPTPTSHPYP
jgi:hypothetical protein